MFEMHQIKKLFELSAHQGSLAYSSILFFSSSHWRNEARAVAVSDVRLFAWSFAVFFFVIVELLEAPLVAVFTQITNHLQWDNMQTELPQMGNRPP